MCRSTLSTRTSSKARFDRPPKRACFTRTINFVDVAIVLAVLGAARSGWRRGLVFYVIDLVGFVASVLLAVRFHEIPAIFWEALGWSDRWSAVLGGLVIFIPLILITAWLGSRAAKAVYKPGLFTLNRVLGVVVAAALAACVVIVTLLFVRAARVPLIGDFLSGSAIASRAIDGVEPAIAVLDDTLGLDLCGGRLERVLTEACEESTEQNEEP